MWPKARSICVCARTATDTVAGLSRSIACTRKAASDSSPNFSTPFHRGGNSCRVGVTDSARESERDARTPRESRETPWFLAIDEAGFDAVARASTSTSAQPALAWLARWKPWNHSATWIWLLDEMAAAASEPLLAVRACQWRARDGRARRVVREWRWPCRGKNRGCRLRELLVPNCASRTPPTARCSNLTRRSKGPR